MQQWFAGAVTLFMAFASSDAYHETARAVCDRKGFLISLLCFGGVCAPCLPIPGSESLSSETYAFVGSRHAVECSSEQTPGAAAATVV